MTKKSIVHEAVQDAKQLKELAVDAAMEKLVEKLTPSVRTLVEKQLRTGKSEDVDRLRRAADGYGETEFEESIDKGDKQMDDKELDLEALVGMFPGLSEVESEELPELSGEPDGDEGPSADDDEQETDEASIPQLGEGEEEEEEEGEEMSEAAKDEEEVDEEVEISEADLKRVYEEARKAQKIAEVMVTKGFKDMSASGELDEVDPAAGIADVKKGDTHHNEKGALPPDRKDWTVKEVKTLIRKGMLENQSLKTENAKLKEMLKLTVSKLTETNLFNAKVLHVNKLFTGGKLTKEQKKSVVNSIDTARTVDEVKKISLALESTFRATGVMSEARKPRASTQGARTSGGANQQVLRESVNNRENSNYSRWQTLAGIVNKK